MPGTCPTPAGHHRRGSDDGDRVGLDRAGNTASATAAVQIDQTAPTISATVSPPPNASGWSSGRIRDRHVHLLRRRFRPGHGLPGAGHRERRGTTPVSGSVTDVAGNTATANVSIQLDRTAPTISASVAPSRTPTAGTRSLGQGDLHLSDTGSGIASGACPAPVTVSTEGVTPVNASVTDQAGNLATIAATVRLDRTKPVITGTIVTGSECHRLEHGRLGDRELRLHRWRLGPRGRSLSGTGCRDRRGNDRRNPHGTDIAGNVGSATATVKLDRTPPVVTVSGFPLLPICSTTDALSGVANRATISFTFAMVSGVPTGDRDLFRSHRQGGQRRGAGIEDVCDAAWSSSASCRRWPTRRSSTSGPPARPTRSRSSSGRCGRPA